MDIKKLTTGIRTVGGLVVLGALFWWYRFYSAVANEFDANLIDALPCIAISSGECGLVRGLAELGGFTPYNPLVFWLGIVLLAVGLLLSYSLKSEADVSNS